MSGGHWGYQSERIRDQGERMQQLLNTVAKTEHLMDWAICADTAIEEEKHKLWDLWEEYFDSQYG